jgi:hypothetical protein
MTICHPAAAARRRTVDWLGAALLVLALQCTPGDDASPAAAAASLPPPGPRPAAAVDGLALLVGINDYLPSGREDDFASLAGAENDVARARDLLLGRFGFAAEQILTLVGAEATHERIVRAFHEHLIQRAGPQTRVVFWFSGHGSRVPDASGADGAPRDAGEAVFDNTLVAHDSRAVDPDGGYDLTDDELASLLAALPAEDVLVVTDCCHSGGVLRGGKRAPGVRECRAGTVPLATARLDAFWPKAVALRDDPHGELPAVVQLAACGALEEAGELEHPLGAFGTLTWCLTETLGEVEPKTAWAEVAAIVRARVSGIGTRPGQRVQLVGDGARAVFGGRGRPVPPGYAVDRLGRRSLSIAVGTLHGVNEGAELELRDLGGKPVGTARVVRARTTTCVAEWDGSGEPPAGGLRAVEKALADGQPRLKVAIEDLDGELLDGSPVALAVPPAAADYVLRRHPNGLGLFDRSGRCVRSCAYDPIALATELQREQRFQTLWQGVAAPGRYELELRITPTPADAPEVARWPPARLRPAAGRGVGGVGVVVGAATLGEKTGGALVDLTVVNHSDADLFIVVLSATETREVNVLRGAAEGDGVVRAHGSVRRRVLLGPAAGWPEAQPMLDRYIAVATPRHADFGPFESKATYSPTRGTVDPALPPFLRAALGSARTRGDMDRPAWGIATCDVQLVQPQVYEATQPK